MYSLIIGDLVDSTRRDQCSGIAIIFKIVSVINLVTGILVRFVSLDMYSVVLTLSKGACFLINSCPFFIYIQLTKYQAKKHLISKLDKEVSKMISFNHSNSTEVTHVKMDALLSRKRSLILILTLSILYSKIWVIMFFSIDKSGNLRKPKSWLFSFNVLSFQLFRGFKIE